MEALWPAFEGVAHIIVSLQVGLGWIEYLWVVCNIDYRAPHGAFQLEHIEYLEKILEWT